MTTTTARLTAADIRNQATCEAGIWLFEGRPASAWIWDGGNEELSNREANRAHMIGITLECMNEDE